MLERERSLKRRRLQQAKGKAKAKALAETEKVGDEKEESLLVVPSDSEKEVCKAKKGPPKKDKTPAQMEKEKEREAQKAAKEKAKNVSKQNIAAAKAMPALQSLTSSLDLALKQIEKLGVDSFEPTLVQALKDALEQMTKWKAEAADVLHLFTTNKTKITEDHLSFDSVQFAATHKAASEFLTDYREKAKKLREEAAAKKNQGPAAKGKKAKK